MLDPNSNTHSCAIGLDVGGTKIAGGVVSFPSGRVLAKQVIPTLPTRGGKAVLDDSLALAKTLMAEAHTMGLAVQGIGVGVAELVDLAGNVTSAHTIDWPGLSAQAAFSKLAPAIVESDVRAPALAEAMFGAGRSYRLFAYVTIGTGISYCLVQDGKPYAGARGNALVLTSGPLTFRCPGCGAVSQSIVEEIASGPALAAHYSQLSAVQVTKAEAVLAAVEAGDTIAIQTVETAAEALGSSVGFMINLLDPEAVIVGGGLGLAGGLYWDRFVSSTRAHIYAGATRVLPIQHASLGVDAGLIGAAATIFRRQYNDGGV
jgi:glucokinase